MTAVYEKLEVEVEALSYSLFLSYVRFSFDGFKFSNGNKRGREYLLLEFHKKVITLNTCSIRGNDACLIKDIFVLHILLGFFIKHTQIKDNDNYEREMACNYP